MVKSPFQVCPSISFVPESFALPAVPSQSADVVFLGLRFLSGLGSLYLGAFVRSTTDTETSTPARIQPSL